MGIRFSVDAPPRTFRPPAANRKLDRHDDQGRQQDTYRQNPGPDLPEGFTCCPEQRQTDQPKPGVSGMCQEAREAPDHTGLFGNPHLRRGSGVHL